MVTLETSVCVCKPMPGALWPLSSITGLPSYPGCVVPSIVTGAVMGGSAVLSTSSLFAGAPGILNLMMSWPGVLLALRIAVRSEPIPLSLVVVTSVGSTSTCVHAENSDVLPAPSVAVAVMKWPNGTASVKKYC
jgi:hypothetical protein